MAGTEAKDLATYIIEPVGTNLDSPTSFTVRKRFQDVETTTSYTNVSTMFSDVMDQMTRPTASASNMKGGLLYLKNGTYLFNTSGIIVSDATDGANVHLRMIGETRERTILKTGYTGSGELILGYCSVDLENLTLDGNSSGTTIHGLGMKNNSIPSKILNVTNCKFTRHTGFNIFCSTNIYGIEVSHCIFDKSINTWDQFAVESTGYSHIHDNFFDRSTDQTNGEGLTSGSLKNSNIHNNTFKRINDGGNSISLEGFDAHNDYDNVLIHGNAVQGCIRLGGSGTWAENFRNIRISDNIVTHGSIGINGPDTSPSGKIMDVTIENNTIIDAWGAGIYVTDGGGYTTIRNNTIKNSNASLDATTFDKGCIYLNDSIDVICDNNNIYMGTGAANFTPYGIRYDTLVNPTIRGNRIINRTANLSYSDVGGNSGTMQISRSL